MSECRRIRSRFTDYVDDSMRATERAGIEAHLAECDTCRGYFGEHVELLQTVEDVLFAPEPTYTFDDLRVRMAEIEPVREILAFVPKMRMQAPIPRFALAFVMMTLVFGLPTALRCSREMACQLRRPSMTYEARVDQKLDEIDDPALAREADALQLRGLGTGPEA